MMRVEGGGQRVADVAGWATWSPFVLLRCVPFAPVQTSWAPSWQAHGSLQLQKNRT